MEKMPRLLTRDQFREQVLARNGGRCVFCQAPAVDAHHILERKLWHDGGYYLDNGAGVCSEHHMACERTEISVEDVRAACGIKHILLPPQMVQEERYDKWGNPLLSNGQRMRGELFDDPGAQKMLSDGGVLSLFTQLVKYPRTPHLPWSEGVQDDDSVIETLDELVGQEVVITEKMDGENTSLYSNYMHARSVDGQSHPSRNWVKAFSSTFARDIPEGWRVCGENLYARHSIGYDQLPSYFLGFSIWNERNICLSWGDTLMWFDLLGITPVPTLYRGVFTEKVARTLWDPGKRDEVEGYVVRRASEIAYAQFSKHFAKFVRKGHVQTDKHWRTQKIIPNGLLHSPGMD